jgi:hypothetical protein
VTYKDRRNSSKTPPAQASSYHGESRHPCPATARGRLPLGRARLRLLRLLCGGPTAVVGTFVPVCRFRKGFGVSVSGVCRRFGMSRLRVKYLVPETSGKRRCDQGGLERFAVWFPLQIERDFELQVCMRVAKKCQLPALVAVDVTQEPSLSCQWWCDCSGWLPAASGGWWGKMCECVSERHSGSPPRVRGLRTSLRAPRLPTHGY